MQMEVDGVMVDVMPVSKVQEYSKTQDWYNSDLDAVGNKRHASAMAQGTKSLEEARVLHASELQQAQTLATGSNSDKMQALLDANSTLTKGFNDLKTDLATEKENGIKSTHKATLASALSSVADEFVRESLIESGMKSLIVGEDGQMYFKLDTGEMVDASRLAESYSNKYPQHFLLNQPSGAGITGGNTNVAVPNKPYKDMSIPEKAAYLEQKGK